MNVINLQTFILCWNDIYKTAKYHKYKKYMGAISNRSYVFNPSINKKYFIMWLNSVCGEITKPHTLTNEELKFVTFSKKFVGTISF